MVLSKKELILGTPLILCVCILLFVFSLTLSLDMQPSLIASGQFYRLITATFAHKSFSHIFANMLAFIVIAPFVEKRFGSVLTIALFIGFGFIVNALGFWWTANTTGTICGASCSIFAFIGMLFASCCLNPKTMRSKLFLPCLIVSVAYIVLTNAMPFNLTGFIGHCLGLFFGILIGIPLSLLRS